MLERSRRSWSTPDQVVDAPDLLALLTVARARVLRVEITARRRQLEGTIRKLSVSVDSAATRGWIVDFMGDRPPGLAPAEEEEESP